MRLDQKARRLTLRLLDVQEDMGKVEIVERRAVGIGYAVVLPRKGQTSIGGGPLARLQSLKGEPDEIA